ncbi:MAG: FKBP-type peptidyl-prolyl cis-trans isomerase [Candidatus Latescibacterota bacterium]
MAQAKDGDTVKVHYTGRLADGAEFDSSQGGEPLEFTIGEGQVIPGFEDAVRGMEPGEKKTITIKSEDAYGPHRDELTTQVDRGQFPSGADPEVGQQYETVSKDSGQSFIMTVTAVRENQVTLDANHPLAGEDLTFDLELVEIE